MKNAVRVPLGPLLCMVLSGAAGLIYEVLWARELALVMGHTVYSLSAVLTAFLGGLALGAWLMGRRLDAARANLKLYAALEFGIGVCALGFPWLIRAAAPVFGLLYRNLGDSLWLYSVAQFAVCSVILLLPTMLMGATLPLMVTVCVENSSTGRGAALFYAANTLGAALGAALGGLVLLPWLGLWHTNVCGAALNAVAAVLSLLSTAPGLKGAGKSVASEKDWKAPSARLVVLAYGLAGFASLLLQVGWVRVVTLSIGSTSYAFTMTLVTFIAGVGLGSALGGASNWLLKRPVKSAAALNLLIGVWSILTIPWLGSLPTRVVSLVGKLGLQVDFPKLLGGELLLVAATIALPTLSMGAMFPLVAQLLQQPGQTAGRAVGNTYSANALGNILGAFAGGFVLVPLIGMRNTIILSGLLSLFLAIAFALPQLRSGSRQLVPVAAGTVVILAVAGAALPGWNHAVLTSGPYLHAGYDLKAKQAAIAGSHAEAAQKRLGELIDYAEGPTSVVAVFLQGEDRYSLVVGGYTDALRYGSSQHLLSHLPLLLHTEAKEMLVVGLGSGITLGAALKHPLEQVDCVEISGTVRDMAAKYFSKFNGGAISDPRSTVMIGDGRNHLRHSDKLYDVIVSQPSEPFVSGAASLFTRDCFQEMHDSLKEGGVACIWYQALDPQLRDLAAVVAAWTSVFPGCYMFESRVRGDFLLIGFQQPQPLEAGALAERLALPAVGEDMAWFGVADVADVLGGYLMAREGMERFSAGAPINSDDNAYVEFLTPKALLTFNPYLAASNLNNLRQPAAPHIDFSGIEPTLVEALKQRLDNEHRGRPLALEAEKRLMAGEQTEEVRQLIEQARPLTPRDPLFLRLDSAAAPTQK